MANRVISWSKTATNQFESVITYIASDLVVNAEKVSEDILKELSKAPARVSVRNGWPCCVPAFIPNSLNSSQPPL